MNSSSFADLGLPDALLEAVSGLGFESPSDIQAAAIPPALEGHDIIGLSETGSGKTAAFALPALAGVDTKSKRAQVLILCPTRELAVQVCEEVHKLGAKMKGLRAVPVYGGAPIDRQLRALRQGSHVIVGTPGRLLDHLRRRSFDPSSIKLAVLDEADRMLDMGFREEMEDLLAQLSPERQTLFFSATMNKGVSRLIEEFGNSPRTVEIKRKTLTVESIEQVSFEVRQRSKVEVLSRIIDLEEPERSIAFCNTKRAVDEATDALLNRGYSADRLHGDISQMNRERTLKRFRDGEVELLVATDVAARGIDVDDIDIVFNYDLPQDPEDYVHRIGRTGRAGKSGRAVSFIFGRDVYRLQSIERYTKQKIPRARIPTLEQVQGHVADQAFDVLQGRLEKKDYADYSQQVDRLLEQGHSATDIASGLLALFQETFAREGEEIQEDRPQNQNKRREREPRERRGDRPDRSDRPERRDREPRGKSGGGANNGEMTTLFLNLGRNNNLTAGAVAGMLYNEANLPNGSVGRIQMFLKHSLIDVHKEHASDAISAGKKAVLFGKPFKLDHHRERPSGGYQDRESRGRDDRRRDDRGRDDRGRDDRPRGGGGRDDGKRDFKKREYKKGDSKGKGPKKRY